MSFITLSQSLYEFEQVTWGTHDMGEIQEAIQQENWRNAQERMTGMGEEQADWEDDE